MTWIKVVPPTPENPEVQEALESQSALYPDEYAPARRAERRVPPLVMNDSIVLSHSLIPEAMRYSFGAFGAMMNPELPLSRRQHEMITTVVSAVNRCVY
jgi:hypothetical protein